jgi:hypothetical protein
MFYLISYNILKTMNKYLIIDSRYRDIKSENTNDFKITLNENVEIKNGIMLLHANIPFSNYMINEYNNKVYINDDAISLEYGNYDINDLVTHINDRLNIMYPNFNVEYLQKLMKFKFTNDEEFQLKFTDSIIKPNEILGFNEDKVYTSIDNQLISDKCVNLHSPHFLNIYIDKLQSIMHVGSTNVIYNKSFQIPVNCNRGGVITYKNQGNENYIQTSTSFYNTNVRITDTNIPFNLNYNDIYLSFVYN